MALETKKINHDNWTGKHSVIQIDKENNKVIIPYLGVTLCFEINEDLDEACKDLFIDVYLEEDGVKAVDPAFNGFYIASWNTYRFEEYGVVREGKDMYITAAQVAFNIL
jgi:hypothetical protein